MAILATNTSQPRELIPAGNYLARCYQMIEIGTVKENIMGVDKILTKVRIGWELPTELRVFNEDKGEQPLVQSKEYTLSMHEKSRLRNDLKSWRGKDFTEEEAKSFDITKLLGVPCMLNITHKHGKADATKVYEEISAITPIPKGVNCPPQINPLSVLSYDSFDMQLFEALPDFIKDKIKSSLEWAELTNPKQHEQNNFNSSDTDDISDLPF